MQIQFNTNTYSQSSFLTQSVSRTLPVDVYKLSPDSFKTRLSAMQLVSVSGRVFSARCNIYISCLCHDASPSVRLSVTEVHWRIIAHLGFKFRSHFTVHCGRRAAVAAMLLAGTVLLAMLLAGESSCTMLASARLTCYHIAQALFFLVPVHPVSYCTSFTARNCSLLAVRYCSVLSWHRFCKKILCEPASASADCKQWMRHFHIKEPL